MLVDKDACTLCLSCVNACPAGALLDHHERPELRFIEKNCVQCGLVKAPAQKTPSPCGRACRWRPSARSQVLNSAQPYGCIRAASPLARCRPSRPCWAGWRATPCSGRSDGAAEDVR